jgi:hypothetical protein
MKIATAEKFHIAPAGTAEALAFSMRHFPKFQLPQGELFAFAVRFNNLQAPTYVIVGDVELALRLVAYRWTGTMGMDDTAFGHLERLAWREAKQCGVKPPYSVTLVNGHGALSFCMRAKSSTPFCSKEQKPSKISAAKTGFRPAGK